MWYDGTVNYIEEIVRWLESTNTNDGEWEHRAELASDVRREVERMATPTRRPDKGVVQFTPGEPHMVRALPHVREMERAVYSRDRAWALEAGRAALAAMRES